MKHPSLSAELYPAWLRCKRLLTQGGFSHAYRPPHLEHRPHCNGISQHFSEDAMPAHRRLKQRDYE